ncbi:MAG: ABC transporter permease subunit, partial [Spirochaetales bacterium]|nr:ABC transporter permease subunit [Spirochaetales bacterium]
SSLPARPALSALSVMRNSVDYVLMIGALLAIFLGFDSLSRDYQEKTMHIILTRSVYRDEYLSGKIAGGLGLILLLHGAAFIIEMAGLGWIGSEAFGLHQAGVLLAFHLAATVYMMLFYLVALLFSGFFLRSLPAFLTSVTLWLGTSYVLPEMAKSLKTFLMVRDASLQAVQSTQVSTPLSTAIEILSPAYHFRTLGTWLFSGTQGSALPFPSLIFLVAVTAVPALVLYLMFNSREVGANE